jgi:enoyl-CoA hydratase/carnithine racemase
MARKGSQLVPDIYRGAEPVLSRHRDAEDPDSRGGAGNCIRRGFELALACDFLVAADTATLRCVEVTTAMLPIAGALQRIAERAGRARASRFAMLGEPMSGREAGVLGIASHVVPENELASVAAALTRQLATGPTRSYAATRTLLKAWSSGGVAGADLVMLDIAMELYDGADAQRGFANTADAYNKDIEPPTLMFEGK